jgi:hypothetical protein
VCVCVCVCECVCFCACVCANRFVSGSFHIPVEECYQSVRTVLQVLHECTRVLQVLQECCKCYKSAQEMVLQERCNSVTSVLIVWRDIFHMPVYVRVCV